MSALRCTTLSILLLVLHIHESTGQSEPLTGDLKLESPNDCLHEGRLEYKHNGVWGTICNDEFTSTAASLACQRMNYTRGTLLSGVTYPGTGPIWLDTVRCGASHSDFTQCSHDPIGRNDCSHSEDVFIACYNGIKREYCPGSEVHEQYEGALRLKDGGCPAEGRLEIFHNNVWGTICDDGFGDPEAYLACQQLGFDTGVTTRAPSPGSGPVWLDDLACTTQHSSLAECGSSRWGREDCSHSEDVGVHCYNTSATLDCYGNPVPPEGGVRIVNGECPYSGRLEIWHGHQWGTVCDVGFNDTDAVVGCKQLGYSFGWMYTAPAAGSGTHIWVKNFGCKGDEANMSLCSHDSWGSTYGCGHERDVGLLCSNENVKRDCAGDLINHSDGDIRLVGGNCSAYGLLEIYHQGRWGTVCDDSFTNVAASVACKQLGFLDGFIRAPPRYGSGVTWLDNVRCSVTDTRLSQCPHAPWGIEDCGHTEDIGIQCFNGTGSLDCDGNPYPEEGKIRLTNSNCSHTGRLEIFHAGRWGSICDIGFGQEEADVACKELGHQFGFLGTVESYTLSRSPGHTIWLKGLSCAGTEPNLHACPRVGGWGETGCDFNQDIFITCSNTSTALDCSRNPVRFIEGQIRLAEGNNHSSGRLEVFHSGRWGSVCDDSFGSVDATVACRELGFHRGQMGSRTLAPDGRGPTWLDELACTMTDTRLALCRHPPWGREDCGNSEDVRLLCENTTECDSNPCLNGAVCNNGFNAYQCNCKAGFSGVNCQINLDECVHNPCENGATCSDLVNDYNCECLPGFSGKNCSTDIDDCVNSPCKNGASCNDLVNRYTCTCVSGYVGTLCETNVDECLSFPCHNGGKCTDKVNGFDCKCKPGFTGKVCESNTNDCDPNPCKNNATCLDGNNWFFCRCPAGFGGKFCEVVLSQNAISPQSGGSPSSAGSGGDGSAKGIAVVALCIAILVIIIVIVLVVRASRRTTRTKAASAADKRANIRWKILGGRAPASDDGREDEVAVWNGSSDKVNLVP